MYRHLNQFNLTEDRMSGTDRRTVYGSSKANDAKKALNTPKPIGNKLSKYGFEYTRRAPTSTELRHAYNKKDATEDDINHAISHLTNSGYKVKAKHVTTLEGTKRSWYVKHAEDSTKMGELYARGNHLHIHHD